MSKSFQQDLPFVPEWLAKKIDSYIQKKNHLNLKTYQVDRHNIYILPSKSGWLFIASLIAILTGAINYNNNMAYLLCFFLSSLGFIAMLQTHQNLNKLIIKPLTSKAVFPGQEIEFSFNASPTDSHHHIAIETQNNHNILSIDQAETTEFTISDIAKQRGLQNAKRFKLFTEFPLGLFHAWTQLQLNNSVVVYPKPVNNKLLTTDFYAGNHQKSNLSGDDEFAGIRDFKKGDSTKSMAWKAIAKTNKLYTKEFHTETGDYLIFDFNKIDNVINLEEKLSILCYLIINASKEKIHYGLKLPNQTIEPDQGDSHKHKCLTSLALYNQ